MKNAYRIAVFVLAVCLCVCTAFADDPFVDTADDGIVPDPDYSDSDFTGPDPEDAALPDDEDHYGSDDADPSEAPEVLDDGDLGDDGDDHGGNDTLEIDTLVVNGDIILYSVPENNEYPPNSPFAGALYIQANTSQLGSVMIYLPVNFQRGSITFDRNGNLVNITSGTITGFMYRGNTQYNFRMQSFGTPEYRLYNTSNAFSGLMVTSIQNTNVVLVEQNSDLPVVPPLEVQGTIIIFMLGVLILCMFMKR